MNKKVMISIPTTGFIYSDHQTAMFGLERGDIDIVYATSSNSLIYDARNKAAEMMLKENFDYLLFIDSDMVPPADVVKRLINHDKDIVSGLYFKRAYPFLPVAYTKFRVDEQHSIEHEYLQEWEDELMPIEAFGMGCCLIKLDVLKKMHEVYGNHLFDCEKGIGEDQMFCVRARNCGYDLWLDTTLVVPHLSIQPISDKHYMAAMQFECQKAKEKK